MSIRFDLKFEIWKQVFHLSALSINRFSNIIPNFICVCVCVCVCVCAFWLLHGKSCSYKHLLENDIQAQLCPSLCDPLDYTVHGILQARILEWTAFLFPRVSSQAKDWTQVSRIRSPALQVDSLPAESQGKPKNTGMGSLSLLQ